MALRGPAASGAAAPFKPQPCEYCVLLTRVAPPLLCVSSPPWGDVGGALSPAGYRHMGGISCLTHFYGFNCSLPQLCFASCSRLRSDYRPRTQALLVLLSDITRQRAWFANSTMPRRLKELDGSSRKTAAKSADSMGVAPPIC
jgi:hypothetical protein